MQEGVQGAEFLLNDLLTTDPQHFEDLFFGCSSTVADPQTDGFGAGQGQDLAGIHNAGVPEAGVHHAFSKAGITVTGFGGGPHGGPHIGLVFVRYGGAFLVDHRSGTDAGTGNHVDSVSRQSDQGTGRGGIVIDPNHDGYFASKEPGAYAVRQVNLPTVGVEADKHKVSLLFLGFRKGQLDLAPKRGGHLVLKFKTVYSA